MKYIILSLLFINIILSSLAQVGIGTNSPNASAQLDVESTNKGFLPPRVVLTGRTDASTIASPATGLLVYNTTNNGTAPNNVTPGFYYNAGTQQSPNWVRLIITNEAVQSVGSISSTSDSKGASITSGVLSLAPANGTSGGIVTTGDQTFAGSKTFTSNINVNNVSVGAPTSGVQNTMLGTASFGYSSPGNNNTALGFFTLASLSGGADNTAVGTNAIRQGGAANGSRNTAVGSAALTNGAASSDNVAIGVSTLSNATGGANTAVGTFALQNTTTARENVGLGFYALHHASQGGYNTAIGSYSMFINTTGDVNTAVGHKSLFSNLNGRYNTSVGVQAQESNTSGSQNTAIGVAAIDQNTTGSNNAVLGAFAGRHFGANYQFNVDKTTAINNSVLIGYDARPLANDANNEIVIGYNAVGKGNNTIQLGNTSINAVHTSGTITSNGFVKSGGTSSQFLKADGSVDGTTYQSSNTNLSSIANLANSAGFLKNNGSGTLSYINPSVSEVTGLGTNVATFLATPSSTNLAAAVTDETGSGALVFGTSPTLTTPNLGAATATSLVSPTITGGTGTTQSLIYKTTTGNGTTGADHIFQVGNNGGTEAMRITNGRKIGIGTANPSTALHIENSNSIESGDPGNNNIPSIYVYNSNSSSSTAHSIVSIRTNTASSGKPYISFDANGHAGYSIGMNNPTDQLIINTDWNFNTGSASKNAVIINETGQSRVIIPTSSGAHTNDWPGGWGGAISTYDISCSGIYYSNLTQRSDRRLKNDIKYLDASIIEKYLNLQPVSYYWNKDKSSDHKLQYGLIAQEVETLFPEMVSIASDSMKTKSVNYQALHALSIKVIQSQQAELDMLKKKQEELEIRLLKLESKF